MRRHSQSARAPGQHSRRFGWRLELAIAAGMFILATLLSWGAVAFFVHRVHQLTTP